MGFPKFSGKSVSIRVKALSNAMLVAFLRYVKREQASLPVDVHRSKTLLLKVAIDCI